MNSYDIKWDQFFVQESLNEKQKERFNTYYHLLHEWNERFNITAIKGADVIPYHFQDSLIIRHLYDISGLRGVADVGSGGGFPGVPLAISYPDLPVVLIEVQKKKITFLQEVVTQLGLDNVQIYDKDWGTFVHTATIPIDLFVSRASLQPKELMMMYQVSTGYRSSICAYWASVHWEADSMTKRYVQQVHEYTVGDRVRKLVIFSNKKSNVLKLPAVMHV